MNKDEDEDEEEIQFEYFFKAGSRTIGGYHFDDELGSGQNGEVWKASKNSEEFAIKRIWSKNVLDFEKVKTVEQNIKNQLMKISSPYLVKYIDVFEDKEKEDEDEVEDQPVVYIVAELCGKNFYSLFENIDSSKKNLTKEARMKIVIELLLGLGTLHDSGILHRNIKPSNAFIDENNDVKLGDYGLEEILDFKMEETYSDIDNPFYLAPEIFGERKGYGYPSDIWSLGVLFYYLFTKRFPFEGNHWVVVELILKGKYNPIQPDICDPEMCKIINSMLALNPDDRPTVFDLLRNHHINTFASEFHMSKDFPSSSTSSSLSPTILSLSPSPTILSISPLPTTSSPSPSSSPLPSSTMLLATSSSLSAASSSLSAASSSLSEASLLSLTTSSLSATSSPAQQLSSPPSLSSTPPS